MKTLYDLRRENAERLETLGFNYQLGLEANHLDKSSPLDDNVIKYALAHITSNDADAEDIAKYIISNYAFTEDRLFDAYIKTQIADFESFKHYTGYQYLSHITTHYALNHRPKMDEYYETASKFEKAPCTTISAINYLKGILERETGMPYYRIADEFETWFYIRNEIIQNIGLYLYRERHIIYSDTDSILAMYGEEK